MTSKIEGISVKTIATMRLVYWSTEAQEMQTPMEAAITALLASGEVVLRKDVEEFKAKAEMLDMIEHECWDLRCVTTAEDDYCWQVVGHWQASPSERVLSGGSTVIKAMEEAMLPRDYDGNLIEALRKFTTKPSEA